jgi:hypothetical protein
MPPEISAIAPIEDDESISGVIAGPAHKNPAAPRKNNSNPVLLLNVSSFGKAYHTVDCCIRPLLEEMAENRKRPGDSRWCPPLWPKARSRSGNGGVECQRRHLKPSVKLPGNAGQPIGRPRLESES